MRESRRETGALLWLVAVIGVLAVGAVFLWQLDSRRGTALPEYSVFRADDRGAALVYRLYQDVGLKPQVWDQDLTGLKQPGLMIMLSPERSKRLFGGGLELGSVGEFLPPEIQALDVWVRKGNVAVVMTGDDNSLYDALGIRVEEPRGAAPSRSGAVPTQPSLLARGVSAIETQTQFAFKYGGRKSGFGAGREEEPPPPPIQPVPQPEWQQLFVKKSGPSEPAQVLAAARGQGLYIVVNDVYPGSNVGLPVVDDAQFMLNLARYTPPGGTIWFDEYHKRAVERSLMGYLRSRAMTPALIYGLLLLGLLFWRTSTRFGPPDLLVADRRRDSIEYVRAVATLYQNARMTRDALATIHADFKRRLAGALRMDGLTNLEEVARRYEARTGRPGSEARQLLIETEAVLARPTLKDEEALEYARRLTELDQALHWTGGGARRKR